MTDDTDTDSDDEAYKPEKGEIVRLTGISWDPWLLIVEVADERAAFAIVDNMNDDVYTPLPDSKVRHIEHTVGDRSERCLLADDVLADDDIDILTAPFTRFEPLNEPHIQGTEPEFKGMHVSSNGSDTKSEELLADGGVSSDYYAPRDASVPDDEAEGYLSLDVDTALDVVPRYWIPVEEDLVEREHVPEGEVVQFPKDDREPEQRGSEKVPDGVHNWDYRDEGGDE